MAAQFDIEQEMAALRQMTVDALASRHLAVCRSEARSKHKERLIRMIVWHLQAQQEGGLSERAFRLASELIEPNQPFACLAGRTRKRRLPRKTPDRDRRLPKVGTILVRQYRDRLLQVRVLEKAFEFEDRLYSSLTAVTREVTGKHWNGFHFFGLVKKDDTR